MAKRQAKQRSRSGTADLRIEALGALGDGIGRLDGRPVYVPLTVPGDRVRVTLDGPKGDGLGGRLVELLAEGPGRVLAPCPQFGQCGGCALQHQADGPYVDWKTALVRAALGRRGLGEAPVEPLLRIAAGTRRRATLAAERAGTAVRLGFNARASRRVVDGAGCLLLVPALISVLPALRAALAAILAEGEHADLAMTSSETGVDVAIAARQRLSLDAREALAGAADQADLARLTWQGDPVAIRRVPQVSFGGVAVDLPPPAFLQPTAAGEAALIAAVTDGLAGCRQVADLYAGCGTFTLPLARRSRVHAVEGDEQAIAALAAAARRAALPQVTTARRDLARDPLTVEELRRFDGVVFDPPRAGAKAQAEQLARSAVPAVVAVSCDPATFARDARALVDGGYRLATVTPIDQFIWSPHVEVVALFRR